MSCCGISKRDKKYWRTLFYFNIDNKNKFIVLSYWNKEIDKGDIERGYILKEELLVYDEIKEWYINPNSYIVEYLWSKNDSIGKETIRLPIK